MTDVHHTLDISARAAAIKPSATLAMSARANVLRAEGHEVLNFAAGEPDFHPPAAVRKRTAELVGTQAMRYAPVPGLPALRQAVADEFTAYHGRAFAPDEILVSCGAKHSLANLFLVTLSAGDEVVIPAPYWVSYPSMVGLAGGDSVIAPTSREHGWRLRPEELERNITERTRFLVLNSPGNPTGAGYRAEHVRALGEVLAAKAPRAYMVCDDIYRKLVYGDFEHASAFKALEGITDQIVLVDGVSKSHAMTGYRIGFLAAPTQVIKAAGAVQGQTTSGATTSSQHAAVTAITDPSCEGDCAEMRTAFARRRELVMAGLERIPGVEVHPPDGAFYVFADFSEYCGDGKRFGDDVDLATWLLEEKFVASVPGTAFGALGHLRMSYATDDASLQEGVDRIHAALSRLQP